MPKLRRVSGQEAVHALERLGFVQVRQQRRFTRRAM
jgi:predicted RNA binding protein YcfA (HicA-like mRNA interferase family)